MKNILLFVFLSGTLASFSLFSPKAENPIDKTDFTTQFKSVFEAAKKRFTSEMGTAQNSNDALYKKKYSTTIPFKNATVNLLLDQTDLLTYQVIYSFDASTLEEAKAIKKETADMVKTLVPSDYKTYSTYVAGYAGYMTEMFEYNSDVFAEVSKRPVVRVGIILVSEGKYQLEILVSEPVFKVAERPNQEKK
jgi:hypothetical protein